MISDLRLENETYESVCELIKADTEIWNEILSIKDLGKVVLKDCGKNNDLDNFQIFTPKFIVDDMIKGIGIDNIANTNFNILEPTSGDGAFTCRILELRLKKIKSDNRDEIFVQVLKSIATIYSIELDEKLIQEQRNNVYTIVLSYLKKKKNSLSDFEDVVLRFLISCNFIYGKTNINSEIMPLVCEVGYYMPDSEKPIVFPVWNFKANQVSLCFEEPMIGD